MSQIICEVMGMKCDGCVSKLETSIRAFDSGASISSVDLNSTRVTIQAGESLNLPQVKKAIEAAGFKLGAFKKV